MLDFYPALLSQPFGWTGHQPPPHPLLGSDPIGNSLNHQHCLPLCRTQKIMKFNDRRKEQNDDEIIFLLVIYHINN